MDLKANMNIEANVDVNIQNDADGLDLNAFDALNAEVNVELDLDLPGVNTEVEVDLPDVDVEVEVEVVLPETNIEVHADVNAEVPDVEVGGEKFKSKEEEASTEDLITKKKTNIFAGLGGDHKNHFVNSIQTELLHEGIRRNKIREFIIRANSLSVFQVILNIGICIALTVFCDQFLYGYMEQWEEKSIMHWFKKHQKFIKNIDKLALFISVMFTWVRCSSETKLGGNLLYTSNTFWLVIGTMIYTIFPDKRSTFYLISFYTQLIFVLLGNRCYAVYEKYEYNIESAAMCVGAPLIFVSIILSIMDTEHSGDLIIPTIVLFFWGLSANFTNYLMFIGKKRYLEIENYAYGSQVVYVDMFINIFEMVHLYFSKFEDDNVEDLQSKLDHV